MAAGAGEAGGTAYGKRLGLPDVKDRNFGYGPGGENVHEQPHGEFSDRNIVRLTLLNGMPRIPCNVACNKMKAKVDGMRKSSPQKTWRLVLESAVVGCPVVRWAVANSPVIIRRNTD